MALEKQYWELANKYFSRYVVFKEGCKRVAIERRFPCEDDRERIGFKVDVVYVSINDYQLCEWYFGHFIRCDKQKGYIKARGL